MIETAELEKLWMETDDALTVLRRREGARHEELQEALKCINAKHDAGIAEAKTALIAASNKLMSAIASKTEKDNIAALPFPEGTVFEEWRRPKQYLHWEKARPTGRTAELRVYSTIDPVLKQIGFYRFERGDIILRLRKKDGTIGLLAEAFKGSEHKWRKQVKE